MKKIFKNGEFFANFTPFSEDFVKKIYTTKRAPPALCGRRRKKSRKKAARAERTACPFGLRRVTFFL